MSNRRQGTGREGINHEADDDYLEPTVPKTDRQPGEYEIFYPAKETQDPGYVVVSGMSEL